jgi:hypothetical protein
MLILRWELRRIIRIRQSSSLFLVWPQGLIFQRNKEFDRPVRSQGISRNYHMRVIQYRKASDIVDGFACFYCTYQPITYAEAYGTSECSRQRANHAWVDRGVPWKSFHFHNLPVTSSMLRHFS